LSLVECERLQGFPDNHTKYGFSVSGMSVEVSRTQRYKCLGNAVTVNVVEAIGKLIIDFLGKEVS
jgi:DNA (cytosine-5)-methyltransferase 1